MSHRARLLAAVLGVLVLPAAVLAGPARADDPPGSISGTVVVPPGYDARDVSVVAVPDGGIVWNAYGGTWAASNGLFTITGLAPGDYRLVFGTYNRDMNVCTGNPAWWTGLGQPAVGTCSGGTLTDAGILTVSSGSVTSLGGVPVLSTVGRFEVHGTVVAPPGQTTAGVQAEVWLRGDGAYSNGTAGWQRPASVAPVTLDASGAFGFELLDGYWSDYALRFVDPSDTYALSFANGGLDGTTPGIGAGSVGLVKVVRDAAGADLGTLRLRLPLDRVSGGVTLRGTPEWGRTLTAVSDAIWSDPSVGTEFRWYRNGVAVDGATDSSYPLNAIDDGWGSQISVRAVPAGWWAYDGPPIQSAPVTIANTTPFNRTAPAVSGRPLVGQRLSATSGHWTPTAATYSYDYRWLRDGVPIPGATGSSYVTTAADAGHRLRARVGAARPPACEHCSPWFQGPGLADSTVTGVVRHQPVVGVEAKRKRGGERRGARARVVITVTTTSAGRPLDGRVVVRDGRKRLGTVAVRNGRARLKVRLGEGRHRITATFAATPAALAATAGTRIRL